MRTKLQFLLIFTLLLFLSATKAQTITLHFIGDSTMADYDETIYSGATEQRGWGQMFRQFLVGDISFNNAARNGRSSKSFYEGTDQLWAGVKSKIKSGDYVLIQFAHNDEKDGGITGIGGIGTSPADYKNYLTKYIDETRALGAIPILATPIVRRYFSGTTIKRSGLHDLGTVVGDNNLNYPYAMNEVAVAKNAPILDMTTLTKALVESYGDVDSKTILYVNVDDTHLKAMGGTLFARLAVQDLINKGILTRYLNATPDVIINPGNLDFGNCYVSTNVKKSISISGLNLNPSAGIINIKAPSGFLVSAILNGTYASTLQLNYTSGSLSATNVFVSFEPTEEKAYLAQLTVSNPSGGSDKIVNLTGNALSLTGGADANVTFALTTNSNATITGPVSFATETWSQMYARNYATPSSAVVWPAGTAGGNTQRNLIVGDAWPAGEIDLLETRYVQFTVQPSAGTTFTVNTISFYAGVGGGSGMQYRIMTSKEPTFANPITLENRTSNAGNTMYALSYAPIMQIDGDSEAFYLRFYPWYNIAATSKYLCLQDLKISGNVRTKLAVHDYVFDNSWKMYPNPTKKEVSVSMSNGSGNERIQLINQLGVVVKTNSLKNELKTIDVSDLASGVYYIRLTSGNQSGTKMLIVE